ncbi:MAG TPA: hypothetical protein VNT79_18890 [Phycisphaerae bacterium]|nr:hypothetical protein [Phycisphaerae bacterium]
MKDPARADDEDAKSLAVEAEALIEGRAGDAATQPAASQPAATQPLGMAPEKPATSMPFDGASND